MYIILSTFNTWFKNQTFTNISLGIHRNRKVCVATEATPSETLIHHVDFWLTTVTRRLVISSLSIVPGVKVHTYHKSLGPNNLDIIALQLSYTFLLNHVFPFLRLYKPWVWRVMVRGSLSYLAASKDIDAASSRNSLLNVSFWANRYDSFFFQPLHFLGPSGVGFHRLAHLKKITTPMNLWKMSRKIVPERAQILLRDFKSAITNIFKEL